MALGKALAKELKSGSVLALSGELGAGKTILVKGLITGLIDIDPNLISSPTFTYLHVYQGILPIYHFDLYRLKNGEEFLQMGFGDYLEGEGISLIEWPSRISGLLPHNTLFIELKYLNPQDREISIASRISNKCC